MSSEWPGVGIASILSPPVSNEVVITGRSSSSSCSMWSAWECVRSTWVGLRPCVDTKWSSGAIGAPESTKTAAPPRPSPTTKAFERNRGCMLRERSTGGRLASGNEATGGDHAGLVGTSDDDSEGEDLDPAEPGRESRRDARLLLRGAAAPAPECQARHRRRRDGEEAARAPVHLDAAAGREARRTGPRRGQGEPRGSR